jgi:hypothetical protein
MNQSQHNRFKSVLQPLLIHKYAACNRLSKVDEVWMTEISLLSTVDNHNSIGVLHIRQMSSEIE